MKRFFSVLCFLLFAFQLHAVDEAIKGYYSGTKKPPRPKMQSEEGRDSGVFRELQIPSVLAILKYELEKGTTWTKLSASERKSMIGILDDGNMNFVYTGKQSTMAHSSGAQTIDKNTIKFNQDGWYAAGAPRGYHDIAKTILHELGHVYQERFNWLPRPMKSKEWFPEELETQLSSTNFSADSVRSVTEMISELEKEESCPDISGSWQGELAVKTVSGSTSIEVGQKRKIQGDNFVVTQEGCKIQLKWNNNEISGTMENSVATLNQNPTGALTDAVLTLSGRELAVKVTQKSGPETEISSEGSLRR